MPGNEEVPAYAASWRHAVRMASGYAVGYTSRFGTSSRRHHVGAMLRTRFHASCGASRKRKPACSPAFRAAVAKVAELVDAPALGAGGAARGGSSPPFRTKPARTGKRAHLF